MRVKPDSNSGHEEFGQLDIAAFEASYVDPQHFSHEKHLYIGWSYLQATDLQSGIQRYSTALRRLTRKLGVPGKYHETTTWFFMLLIGERRRQAGFSDWYQFKAENPDLFTDAKTLLGRYYTSRCLESELAREQFVLPDRISAWQGSPATSR